MNIIQIMKALADETRLRLINLVKDQELNVNELVLILDMGQSRISRHLKILSDAGIVRFRRDGLWSFYSLTGNEEIGSFIHETTALLQKLSTVKEDLKRKEFVLQQREQQTSQLFDNLAGNWKYIKAEIYGDLDLIHEIYKIIPQSESVVDIGCGNGDLLMLLKNKANKVIGVDNSPKMLEQAGFYLNQDKETIDLRLGTIEHLPLGNAEVENAVINMVLHHSNAPLNILKEAYRVLKPGGSLILADFKKHSKEIMRTKYGDRHLGFDQEELFHFFKESGFIINTKKHYPLLKGLEIMLFVTTKEV